MSRMWVSPFEGGAVAEPVTKRRPLKYRVLTFEELNQRGAQVARGLYQAGVPVGARIALLVPPGIDFVVWVFGLLRSGAVIVLIDPGMGRRNLIQCLAEARPDGMVGIYRAHLARWLWQRRFPACRFNFLVGGGWCPLARSTAQWFSNTPTDWESPIKSPEEPAAIIFTTGSTGPPKGVLYRHRHFLEQSAQIRDYFHIEPGGVDVSGFPLFALFNAGMGVTTVFPLMDATQPAAIDPLNFIDAVQHFQANQSFGSPALWNTVSRFAETHGIKLPSLKRVLMAGAPVPAHVVNRVRKMIATEGEVFTPYGATEALPVACIESRHVLQETQHLTAQGKGTCVGTRWPNVDWQVIEIDDGPIPTIDRAHTLPPGAIGELMVRGPVVTDQYVTRTDANALHKVRDGEAFWHRMGDVGYLDERGRFWFCGRKSHRVTTSAGVLFTIPCEAIINQHPAIYRSALVGIGPAGDQTPAIVAEPWPEHWPATAARRERLLQELRELAQRHALTQSLEHFYLRRKLPVDIRHNAKIFREKLVPWVQKRMR